MTGLAYSFYQQPFWGMVGLVIVAIWSLVWKGLGLWNAGKNGQRNWFIAMLVLNTAGLLPIIYLIWFKPQKEDNSEETESVKEVKKPSAKKVTSKKVKK